MVMYAVKYRWHASRLRLLTLSCTLLYRLALCQVVESAAATAFIDFSSEHAVLCLLHGLLRPVTDRRAASVAGGKYKSLLILDCTFIQVLHEMK
jgi:hypothetical protein